MDKLTATFKENVRRALGHRLGRPVVGGQSGIHLLTKKGLSTGNASRALFGNSGVHLERVLQVAEALGVEPWQLLVPGYDPAAPPGLTEDPTAWPFEMVDRANYQKLDKKGRAAVQAKFDLLIEQELERGKTKRAA